MTLDIYLQHTACKFLGGVYISSTALLNKKMKISILWRRQLIFEFDSHNN